MSRTIFYGPKDVRAIKIRLYLTTETTFVTSCLLLCAPNSLWKRFYFNRKDLTFTGSKCFSFRIDRLSEGRQNKFHRIASPYYALRKHAYSNILKFSSPKKCYFRIKKSDIFFHISTQNGSNE